jgi:uncharacterized membrane protein YphA (DoxX/SURF4 family)
MRNIATLVISILLAVAFLGAGTAKLLSVPMMVAEFQIFGYPMWSMYLTGALEIVCAVLVLIPRFAGIGAALLACTMIGAILSHLAHGQAAMIAAPVVLLILAVALGQLRGWSRGSLSPVAA